VSTLLRILSNWSELPDDFRQEYKIKKTVKSPKKELEALLKKVYKTRDGDLDEKDIGCLPPVPRNHICYSDFEIIKCTVEQQERIIAYIEAKEPEHRQFFVPCFDGPLLVWDDTVRRCVNFKNMNKYVSETIATPNCTFDFKVEKLDYDLSKIPDYINQDYEKSKESNEDEDQSDLEAAKAFYKWATEVKKIEFVCVSNEIIWYDPEDEIWLAEYNKRVKKYIGQCPDLVARYSGMDKNMNSLLNQMYHMIPINDNWYAEIKDRQVGFLPLKSKVWDFTNKCLVDYESKYGFFHKLKVDYDPEIDTTEVQKYMFDELFNKEDTEYLKTMIARSLAGHGDKNLFFLIGDGNSGKGFFEAGMDSLLGSLLGTISAGNLLHKRNIQDDAKSNSWLVKIKDSLLVMGQEIGMEENISGVQIKKLASGGDKHLGRTNGKDEIQFVYNALTILGVNDIPKIQGLDDATKNRLVYFEMPNVYLPAEADYVGIKNRILIRPDLKKEWIKKQKIIQGLLKLLLDSYTDEKPKTPDNLLAVAREWNDDSGDNIHAQVAALFQHSYETTQEIKKTQDKVTVYEKDENGELIKDSNGNFIPEMETVFVYTDQEKKTKKPILDNQGKEYYIASANLLKKCTNKGIQVSAKKLGAIMKALGYTAKPKKADGKVFQAYFNIRLITDIDQDY